MNKNKHVFFINKRFYNPPSKRKWSKQNSKYKTDRPLVDQMNMHKINIKGEYWKQKHVNTQHSVENENYDFINERTSLTYFGYPNISLHAKLGGSLYIEQMDEVTLCVMMNKCIKEQIHDSYIWKHLLNRCTQIMNRINGSILSYIFKCASQCYYYNHYFYITIIGNILNHLHSLNIKNGANLLYAMNTNAYFYNKDIYEKLVQHCSLLILNRNDIEANDILSIINSYYPYTKSEEEQKCLLNKKPDMHTLLNHSYLLFDSITKTFGKYDLDLCTIDQVASAMVTFCFLNQLNLFIQEKNRIVVEALLHHLTKQIDTLNLKQLAILCYASSIFHKNNNAHWTYVIREIKKDCFRLDRNHISLLLYAWNDNPKKGNLMNVVFNKAKEVLTENNVHNLSIFIYSSLKGSNLSLSKEINNNQQKNKKDPLFNESIYGIIKEHQKRFTPYGLYLICKGLAHTSMKGNKINDLKKIVLKQIQAHITTFPICTFVQIMKLLVDMNVKEKELLQLSKNVALIYLHVFRHLDMEECDFFINEKYSLVEEYYKITQTNNEDPEEAVENDKRDSSVSHQTISNSIYKKMNKENITFLYNEKKRETNELAEKYIIHPDILRKELNQLTQKFGISKELIQQVFSFSKNYFFNYYMNENHVASLFYFCLLIEEPKDGVAFFLEIEKTIRTKIRKGQLVFKPNSIFYIFKSLNHLQLLKSEDSFFQILLNQLCTQIFSVDISLFYDFLQFFYSNKIAHYYFLKKGKYIINMNRYEIDNQDLLQMKTMMKYLQKLLV